MAAQKTTLAWGKLVSVAFIARVIVLCQRLRIDPDYLMACMAWESGETFSPSKRNGAGSGAVGLIQFMPATLKAMGYTVDQAMKMTAVQQLDLVEQYFKPYRGKLNTLSDVYMAILWPAAVGRAESYPLFVKGKKPTALYDQNKGLDVNKDGVITKAECAAKVQAKLLRGMESSRRWEGVI